MKVVVLHDEVLGSNRPDEADSLFQAQAVFDSLGRLGHTAEMVPFSMDFKGMQSRLKKCDVVFNCVESVNGKAPLHHLGPLVIELALKKYTGSSADALHTSANKVLTKRVLASADIYTSPIWDESELPTADREKLFIVKSVAEDASLGLDQASVVTYDQVPTLIAKKKAEYGGEWFGEEYVEGREFNVGLLADGTKVDVLPIAEMRFLDYGPDRFRIVDYKAKWDESTFEYKNSQRHFDLAAEDSALVSELQRISRLCWSLFSLSGYARVDFRVDAQGQPWVLEVNGNPGIAPDSGFIAACAQVGLSYDQTIARILANAKEPSD